VSLEAGFSSNSIDLQSVQVNHLPDSTHAEVSSAFALFLYTSLKTTENN
jgi:hypothetical protein